MADVDLKTEYGWLQPYVWRAFEPALTQVRAKLLDEYPHLWTDISAGSGALYPISGDLQIRKYILGVFIERDIIMHIECSLALASLPTRELECNSYVGRTIAGSQELLSQGPYSLIELGSDDLVRRQVDQWMDATVTYIHSSTDLIAHDMALSQ
jgi:hypothetical protein